MGGSIKQCFSFNLIFCSFSDIHLLQNAHTFFQCMTFALIRINIFY